MTDFSNFTLLHTSTGFFDFSKNLEEGRQGGRMQNREWEKEEECKTENERQRI